MADGGYDVADYRDVDPMFGSLADFDALVEAAHALDLRVIVDIVPNHCSDQHEWFRAAVAAGPGSPERDRFHFRPGRPRRTPTPRPTTGRPPSVDLPGHASPSPTARSASGTSTSSRRSSRTSTGTTPTSLRSSSRSCASGSTAAWTASGSTWPTAWSRRPGCPRSAPTCSVATCRTTSTPTSSTPMFDQPGIHEIYRGWRSILDEYPGERMTVGEVWLGNAAALARYLRPDELNQAFNFRWVFAPWDPAVVHEVVSVSLRDAAAIGAPATWVLSNHDVYRPVTRYGDGPLGLARARATALFMHGLPGLVLRLPGRGARAAGGARPARGVPAGPHVGALRPHRPRPRRLPGADPLVRRRRAVRLRPGGQRPVAPPAGGVGRALGRGPGRGRGLDADALPGGAPAAPRGDPRGHDDLVGRRAARPTSWATGAAPSCASSTSPRRPRCCRRPWLPSSAAPSSWSRATRRTPPARSAADPDQHLLVPHPLTPPPAITPTRDHAELALAQLCMITRGDGNLSGGLRRHRESA